MKPLNHIVADLELSRKLKKLKIKQNSIFYWIKDDNEGCTYIQQDEDNIEHLKEFASYEIVSAFTSSELGNMLPPACGSGRNWEEGDKFRFHYKDKVFKGNNEASLRAEVLIYLLKNNIISLEEVNKNI